ncbi:MAG: YwiC-like family protein [Actinomycetes bacterium]
MSDMNQGPGVQPKGRARRRSLFPPQHGAWAFIGLPIVLGAMNSPWDLVLPAISIAWICAFPISYFLIAILRYPRPGRFVRPLAIWSAVGVPLLVLVVIAQPWLLWFGVGYVVAFGINLAFARHHLERSLVNDFVFVIECTAIVPITWGTGVSGQTWMPPDFGSAPAVMWISTVSCAIFLVASTLHVKSLMRERNDRRFRRASQIWSCAAVLIGIWFGYLLGMPLGLTIVIAYVFMAVRSFWVGRRPLEPGKIGLIESVGFMLLVIAIAIAAA